MFPGVTPSLCNLPENGHQRATFSGVTRHLRNLPENSHLPRTCAGHLFAATEFSTHGHPMKPQRVQRQIICDPATLTRLAWIRAVLLHQYRMPPSQAGPSVIMRRALEAYCVHLERIMQLPDGHADPTRDRDLAQGLEAGRLRAMRRDADLGVTETDAEALPVRPLSELVQEQVAEQVARRGPVPRLLDQLRKELTNDKGRDAIEWQARMSELRREQAGADVDGDNGDALDAAS